MLALKFFILYRTFVSFLIIKKAFYSRLQLKAVDIKFSRFNIKFWPLVKAVYSGLVLLVVFSFPVPSSGHVYNCP